MKASCTTALPRLTSAHWSDMLFYFQPDIIFYLSPINTCSLFVALPCYTAAVSLLAVPFSRDGYLFCPLFISEV